MIEINLFAPMAFDGRPGVANGDWLRAILGSPATYSVQAASTAEISLTATAGSTLAGYRIVLLPATSFVVTPGGAAPMSGDVAEVLLYDTDGKLVASVADLPPGTAFGAIVAHDGLGLAGAVFNGSEGGDTITGFAGRSWMAGGGGDDRLTGGALADVLLGGAGADTMSGGEGNDIFRAGDGADRVDGGDGLDIVDLGEATGFVEVWFNQAAPAGQIRIDSAELIVTGAQGSKIHGSAEREIILGGAGRDDMGGGGGDDVLAAGGGDDTLSGGDGDDLMDGGPGGDLLDGGAGADLVDYSAAEGSLTIDLRISGGQQTGLGLDSLSGVEGLIGSFHNDTLSGDAADNYLEDLGGTNLLLGQAGEDAIYSGPGDDTVAGGTGNDTIDDLAGSNYIRGEDGQDYLYGGAGFDDLNGNMGNDTVDGFTGDDWVVGGKDNDLLRGGVGDDLVYGNLGDDTCEGDGGKDIVRGGQGDDAVDGGGGDDYVSGDRGADTVAGGVGADIFHTFAEAGVDRVIDFSALEGDRVQVDPGTVYVTLQRGLDAVVDMGGGNELVLVNVQLSSLPTGWIFGA